MTTKAFDAVKRPRSICRFCEVSLSRPAPQRRHLRVPATVPFPTFRPLISHKRCLRVPVSTLQTTRRSIGSLPVSSEAEEKESKENKYVTNLDAPTAILKAQELGRAILKSDLIPSEESVIQALEACELAAAIASGASTPTSQKPDPSATKTLLSLDERARAPPIPTRTIINSLSDLSFEIIAHPPVFINAPVLASYVNTQCMLGRPESLPEAFTLYAHKPVPMPGSNPPTYKNPNPDRMSQAVPEEVAADALDAAIIFKDLDLALAVINSAYRTKAYRNNKMFRKLSVPVVGAIMVPGAAYIAASKLAGLQDMVDDSFAIGAGFAGIMTYVGALSMIGYISVTTHNDQMQRVVWRPGAGLTERWIREDERAALDRVAMAWGFKDAGERGLEEGPQWEYLRAWISERGMILDKTELMEGME